MGVRNLLNYQRVITHETGCPTSCEILHAAWSTGVDFTGGKRFPEKKRLEDDLCIYYYVYIYIA